MKSSSGAASQTALLGYEYRVSLKRNKASVLRLFEGRQVQPTDHVIQQVGRVVLRSETDQREVAILQDILDPYKTGYVTLKRVNELVLTQNDNESEDVHLETGSALMVASSKSKNVLSQRGTGSGGRWIPPKRPPPIANASLYAVSTALNLVPHARSTSDPDMLAIMTAIQWSGRHLSQPPSVERRFISSTPLSRYATIVPSRVIPSIHLDQPFPLLSDALKRIPTDSDRGWAIAAVVGAHVRSEVVFREMVRLEVPEILVPEDVLQCFLATPRWYRSQLLDSTKTSSPHPILSNLSPVRLPLVATALRVEMESAARKVANAFLPLDVAGAWARSSEKERCAFVTALLSLGIWDDEIVAAMGGRGLESVLLLNTMALQAEADTVQSQVDDGELRQKLSSIKQAIEEISAKARAPLHHSDDDQAPPSENGNGHTHGTPYEFSESKDDLDQTIASLQRYVFSLTSDTIL